MQIERAKGAAIKITDALELIQFEWMVWVFTFIYYNMDGGWSATGVPNPSAGNVLVCLGGQSWCEYLGGADTSKLPDQRPSHRVIAARLDGEGIAVT